MAISFSNQNMIFFIDSLFLSSTEDFGYDIFDIYDVDPLFWCNGRFEGAFAKRSWKKDQNYFRMLCLPNHRYNHILNVSFSRKTQSIDISRNAHEWFRTAVKCLTETL